MNIFRKVSRWLLLFAGIGLHLVVSGTHAAQPVLSGESKPEVLTLTLSQCLETALANNRLRRVSKAAVAIAEAQYQQARSSLWPRLDVNVKALRMDEDPNFIFPEQESTYTIKGLGPFPMDVDVNVPEQNIKLMDRDSIFSSLDFVFPIYTGGKRRALTEQADIGVKVAKVSARRTDLEVIYDVKRTYYGAVLAHNLYTLGRQTLDRFLATLDITEQLYKTGTGTVKKTDYLRTKVITLTLQSMLEAAVSNQSLAQAALVNTMGLNWQTEVVLSDKKIPFSPIKGDLSGLVASAYRFNPDWEKIQLAVEAAQAGIKKAESGHLPVVALFGSLTHIENDLNSGLMTDENVDSWALGLSVNLPVFAGFQTTGAVKEAKMRFEKRRQQSILFSEGLALMIKDVLLQVGRTQRQASVIKDALATAKENRELNIRAYQNEMAETKDVIEAQLMESLINVSYLKALNDHATFRARLDFLVGEKLQENIN